MFRFSLVVCLCISLPAVAQSTKPATQPVDTAAVAKLVGELGDDDAKVRDSARGRLAAMGPAVAGELEKAVEKTSDPEVRTSLQSLVTELAKVDRSRPTLITLRLNGVPAKTAIDKLAEQSGVAIGGWPDWVWRNNKKTVTLDVENQPFWLVMTDICAQAGLSPEGHGSMGAGRITVQQAGETSKPIATHYKDGFLAIPQAASRNHSINYNRPKQRDESFALSIRILVDPKIRVLQGPYQLAATEAVDENGKDLKTKANWDQDNLHSGHFGNTWLWDLQAPLRYLPEQGKVLKTFKAKAIFVVVDREETWEIPVADAANASKTFSGVTYTVNSLQQQGGGYQMKYTVTWQEGLFGMGRRRENPLTDYQVLQRSVKLLDADGRPYLSQGVGGGGGGGKRTYDQNFRKPDDQPQTREAAKIVWTVPLSTKRIEFPVEFSDLPIP